VVEEQTPVNKSCPFCGDYAILDTPNHTSGKPVRFRVKCRDCEAATKWFDTEERAWAAWDNRYIKLCPGLTVAIFNSDAFVYEGLLYIRNEQSGYCFAQKKFRGDLKRISKKDFLLTSQKAVIAQAERVNTEYEKTTGKMKK
jgi:Lar family restriction alleviation protein